MSELNLLWIPDYQRLVTINDELETSKKWKEFVRIESECLTTIVEGYAIQETKIDRKRFVSQFKTHNGEEILLF